MVNDLLEAEEVDLTTVGVDIGSSTSHLMFARVTLRRVAGALSSRFVVVARETLWRSPILLTPYVKGNTIDLATLTTFVDVQHEAAGLHRDDVDTGAVILTGTALLRGNARAIADVLAADSGTFVCASAGHELEARLAAHGSGATVVSRDKRCTVLNVDIGGGTTKLALIRDGEVVDTAVLGIGGRIVARDSEGVVTRMEPAGVLIADRAGVDVAVGRQLVFPVERALAGAMTDVLADFVAGGATGVPPQLLLLPPSTAAWDADLITFSGGVSESIYGRDQTDHGDLGAVLASTVRHAVAQGRIALPVAEPAEGIRATVIGAAQFSMQVSGNTIFVSDPSVLPLHNLAVVRPDLTTADPNPGDIAATIDAAVERSSPDDPDLPVALAVHWTALPEYQRIRSLAEGIAAAQRPVGQPIVVVLDGDIGRTLGRILATELSADGVVCIDGLRLDTFDFVDIGQVVQPAGVVPVVIKSLLFPDAIPA